MSSIMIQFISLIAPYIKKTIVVFQIVTSKKGLIILPPLLIAVPVITTKQHMGLFLALLMIIDFATGVAVSYKNKKEEEKFNTEFKKRNLISSEKLKKSGVKFLLYLTTIGIAYWFDTILKIRTFSFDFSKINFTITILIMLWWIIVETYSIVFENFKELGFDVMKVFTKLINAYKKGKKQID